MFDDKEEEYDERGNLIQRAGRRATRAAAARMSINNGILPEDQENSKKAVKSHKKGLDAAHAPPIDAERTCTICKAVGHSGHYCPNACNFCKAKGHATNDCPKLAKREEKRAAAEEKAAAAEKALTKDIRKESVSSNKKKDTQKVTDASERKEALHFGPQFAVGAVVKSIGWAEVNTGVTITSMNCTAVWNGFYVSQHVFPSGTDHDQEITFFYGELSGKAMKKDGKKIGNDSLFFPCPASLKGVPRLRTAETKEGDKVTLLCYNSREAQSEGHFKTSTGTVKSLTTIPGAERAHVTYSSDYSNCGSPVINDAGKCVGWHNARTSTENVFIPVTKHLVGVATGSSESF